MSKRLEKGITAALKAAPHLDHWPCQHFPICGGCALQDRSYVDQVAAKRQALLGIWGEQLPTTVIDEYVVTPSLEPFNYRLRMDYVCSDDRFGLRQRKRFYSVVDLQECHLIPPLLFAKVRSVYQYVRSLNVPDYNVYHNTGFLRYLVVRRNVRNDWMLTFITAEHDYLDAMAQAAQFALDEGATSVWWLHNPRHADISFGAAFGHWGAQHLTQYIAGAQLLMGPNTFFQNNPQGFEQILDYCAPFVAGATRLVDLYAGVGTIGIVLGRAIEHVLAAELVEESVDLLRVNVELNGVAGKTEIIGGDIAELVRDFAWQAGDVAVLDPPRAGLLPPVCRRLDRHGPQRIVYISCNPITQVADVAMLTQYQIVAARGFDLFGQTYHAENVVVLERVSDA